MNSLKDKVAIITGASRGIGAHIAKRFAFAGAKVAINFAANQAAADAVVSEINSSGGTAMPFQADVSNADEVKKLFEEVETHFGKISILVNNAGVLVNRNIQDTSDDDFDKIISVNVKGTFNTLREAANRLENGGSIINLSSTVTRVMLPTYGVYAASKAAVEQLTRVLAKEIGARGIRVNSLSPGPTNTELFTEGKSDAFIAKLAGMSALGRIGDPHEIANIALFLASDDSSWVTGQNIGANGGFA